MADNLESRLNSNTDSDNLEAKANNHNSPEIIKFLEEKAKTRKPRGTLGKIVDYTIAAGAVAASYSLIGPTALIANGLTFIGARIVNHMRKRDTPSRQVRNQALISSLFSIPGHYAFKWMNTLWDVTKWSGLLSRFAAQNFIYAPFMYIAGNLVGYPLVHGTTKGLYEYGIKDLGWRNYKSDFKYFSIPNLFVSRYLPPQSHFPINLGMGLLWRTTIGSRYLHEADPYKYEHEIIDGKPANGYANNQKQLKDAA
jgi:hypothetical protein